MPSFKMHSKFFQTSSRNGHQRRLPNTSLQDIPTGLAEIIVDRALEASSYEHFDRQRSNYSAAARDKGKCRLWDSDTNPDEKAVNIYSLNVWHSI